MHALIAITAIFFAFAPVSDSKAEFDPKFPALETVDFVDVQSYMGKWYEVARITQRFQRNCGASKAFYELDRRGRVEVTNSCQELNNPEHIQSARALARIADPETNAKLKVSFVPIFRRLGWFSGNYWVIALDDNYQYAMVGEPTREFLWILSRTPVLEEHILEELYEYAQEVGYDISKLERTPEWQD